MGFIITFFFKCSNTFEWKREREGNGKESNEKEEEECENDGKREDGENGNNTAAFKEYETLGCYIIRYLW